MLQGHHSPGARESSHNEDKNGLDLVQGAIMPTTLSLLGQTLTSYNGQRSGGLSQSPFTMSNHSTQSLRAPDFGRSLGIPETQERANTMQLSHQLAPSATVNSGLSYSGSLQAGSSTQALMNSLNILQQNIGALQALVPLMSQTSQQPANGMQSQQLQHQQALASAGVAAVISQLAVAAAGILPQVQQGQQSIPQQNDVLQQQQSFQNVQGLLSTLCDLSSNPYLGGTQGSQGAAVFSSGGQGTAQAAMQQNINSLFANETEKNDDADGYIETLPEGSYDVVEMDPVEILAEHTHFCEICGKGFKRDANLRMHMRGHGDEYKTPAALSRPDKDVQDMASMRPRRFSCPYVGCKRNRKHKKFQPLKTMLCVKNHYRRSHCPKMLTCSKCNAKRFSVVADLKTHEKHCGRDKWMCSCRTTFSRKDKLLGHLSLFAGHTPAMPLHIMEEGINNSGGSSTSNIHSSNNTASNSQSDMGASQHQLLTPEPSSARQASPPEATTVSSLFGQGLSGANFYSSSLLQGLFTSNLLEPNVGSLR